MHGLRASLLFRRSDRFLTLGLLCAAQALFLWMFLSTDPLEQLAPSDAGLRFASDWRHGMAGNSWLYMPGFLATAAALWLHARTAGGAAAREAAAAAVIAMAVAAMGSWLGARMVSGELARATGIVLPAVLPAPSPLGAARGLYTLVAWSVFVLACRLALLRRSWRPFVLPALLAVGLALIRPWTVDDFLGLWRERVAAGDVIASASLAAVGIVAGLLAASAQRSQSRSKPT
jgi:hypothetical protein